MFEPAVISSTWLENRSGRTDFFRLIKKWTELVTPFALLICRWVFSLIFGSGTKGSYRNPEVDGLIPTSVQLLASEGECVNWNIYCWTLSQIICSIRKTEKQQTKYYFSKPTWPFFIKHICINMIIYEQWKKNFFIFRFPFSIFHIRSIDWISLFIFQLQLLTESEMLFWGHIAFWL